MSEKNNKPRPSHFNVLTYKAPCPSCGADVEFTSAASVMSVCGYCQTTVVREGDDVKSQGKQSAVIEDHSPLQLGSSGTYGKHTFVLVGRIQLEYTEGVWNEWYIQFDNGKAGWLSETLDQYSLTLSKGKHPALPGYHQLHVGQTVQFEDIDYTVTDRRTATAIAGEGELPFVMGKGWQTWIIDAQYQRQFITLDYADTDNGENDVSGAPTVYQGTSVSLAQLAMQGLKDDRQMNEAGNLGSEEDIAKIDCPNCGSPVPYIAGATNCLLCPACHSEVKLTGETAEVVQVHSMMQAQTTSLQLGDKARINTAEIAAVTEDSENNKLAESHDYVVIGIMRLQEVGEYAFWTEYLLYSFTDGFLWLGEESDGWRVARILSELPTGDGKHWIQYQGKKWHRKYDEDYRSQVVYAIGAFNWQVKLNDSMVLRDFSHGQQTISKEQNAEEISYTIASPVTVETLNAWFGKNLSSATIETGLKERKGKAFHIIMMLFVILSVAFVGISMWSEYRSKKLHERYEKYRIVREKKEAEWQAKEARRKAACLEKHKDNPDACEEKSNYSPPASSYNYYKTNSRSSGGRTGYSSSGSHK